MKKRRLLTAVPVQVAGLSIAYAGALGWLERKFPDIKPDYIWAEVVGGVLVSLVPVAMQARQYPETLPDDPPPPLHWQTYEGSVWAAFIAAGAPIVLWQLGESLLRRVELIDYVTQRQLDWQPYAASLAPANGGTAGNGTRMQQHIRSISHEALDYLRRARTYTGALGRKIGGNPRLAQVLVADAHGAANAALERLEYVQQWLDSTTNGGSTAQA